METFPDPKQWFPNFLQDLIKLFFVPLVSAISNKECIEFPKTRPGRHKCHFTPLHFPDILHILLNFLQ